MQMADPKCTEPTLSRGPPNCQNHPQAGISGCPLDTSQVKPQSLEQDVPVAPQTLLLSPCPHVAQTQPFCSPCGQAAVPGLPDYPSSASWEPHCSHGFGTPRHGFPSSPSFHATEPNTNPQVIFGAKSLIWNKPKEEEDTKSSVSGSLGSWRPPSLDMWLTQIEPVLYPFRLGDIQLSKSCPALERGPWAFASTL